MTLIEVTSEQRMPKTIEDLCPSLFFYKQPCLQGLLYQLENRLESRSSDQRLQGSQCRKRKRVSQNSRSRKLSPTRRGDPCKTVIKDTCNRHWQPRLALFFLITRGQLTQPGFRQLFRKKG